MATDRDRTHARRASCCGAPWGSLPLRTTSPRARSGSTPCSSSGARPPTPYRRGAEVEARVETGVSGNILTDPAKGLCFRFRAYNASQQPNPLLRGRFRVTDFWGRTVWEEKPDVTIGPQQSIDRDCSLLHGRQGFFRFCWEPEGGLARKRSLRRDRALSGRRQPLRLINAFGREFVLRLAHLAGLRCVARPGRTTGLPARRDESHHGTAPYRSTMMLARCENRGWPKLFRHTAAPGPSVRLPNMHRLDCRLRRPIRDKPVD